MLDVGPPQYYGYKLTWPYNERNVNLGIYETLLWWNGELQPRIATSWSLDATSVTLKIRKDVPFHNSAYGNVTPEDVVFTFANNSRDGTLHTGASVSRRNYTKYEVVDSETVRFTFSKPTVDWSLPVRGTFGIESKKWFEDRGEEAAILNSNGTGPYRMMEHVADDHLFLEAVSNHWRKTAPFKTVRVLEVPEQATRVAMLRTREADVVQIGIPVLDQVAGVPGLSLNEGRLLGATGTAVFPAGQYYQKADPQTGNPTNRVPIVDLPWVGNPDDPADMARAAMVRKALSHALDREAVIDTILGGRGCAQYQYRVHSCDPHWQSKWETPYDPDKARQLLRDAGYPNGFEFTFFIPSGINQTMEEVAEAVAPMWEAVGLRPRIEKAAYSARRPTMLDRSIKDVWIFIHGDMGSPDLGVQQVGELGGRGVWNMGIERPESIAYADRILAEPDLARAWDIVAEWLDWLSQEQPVIQVVTWRDPWAAGPRIASWEMPVHTERWPSFLEYIVPAR